MRLWLWKYGGEGYYRLRPVIASHPILTKNVLYLLRYVGLMHSGKWRG